MNKILYTATSDIHLKTFHFPYLKWLKSNGFEVHVAIEKRGEVDLSFCDKIFYLPFKRAPFSYQNFEAYKALKKIINDQDYKIIHCHTPAVSVLTRLASRKARVGGTKVFYTAHGYHFYKGAPFKFWLLFFPIEWLFSLITDVIVLINKEDFDITKRFFFNKHTYYLKGMGIDPLRFRSLTQELKQETRFKLGFERDKFILLYTADFIDRKNHRFLIEAIPSLVKKMPDAVVLLAGKGELLEEMKDLASKLKIESHVRFLGWRDDVPDLVAISDLAISTSKQEGLGLGLAEAMLCSVPVVATVDRGHREMISNGINGYLFEQKNSEQFINRVYELYNDFEKRIYFGGVAKEKAQEFLIEKSLLTMGSIYLNHTTENAQIHN